VHCAIHFGQGDWSQANSTYLMPEESIPVCAPSLFRQANLSQAANVCARLVDLPLLHIATRPEAWSQWFSEHNLLNQKLSKSEIKTKVKQGMHFEQFSIATNAAVAGLGVALLPRFLIKNELQRGELQVVCNRPLNIGTGKGYYLVTPNDKLTYAPTIAFRNWLTQVISTEAPST